MIILFTPPSDQKVLDEEKTMTARLWRKKPPKIGEVVRAQTGRKKETSFAHLKVIDVWEWTGYLMTTQSSKYNILEIGKKEGFDTPTDFTNGMGRWT